MSLGGIWLVSQGCLSLLALSGYNNYTNMLYLWLIRVQIVLKIQVIEWVGRLKVLCKDIRYSLAVVGLRV